MLPYKYSNRKELWKILKLIKDLQITVNADALLTAITGALPVNYVQIANVLTAQNWTKVEDTIDGLLVER